MLEAFRMVGKKLTNSKLKANKNEIITLGFHMTEKFNTNPINPNWTLIAKISTVEYKTFV